MNKSVLFRKGRDETVSVGFLSLKGLTHLFGGRVDENRAANASSPDWERALCLSELLGELRQRG
jgi:hypothetical protein